MLKSMILRQSEKIISLITFRVMWETIWPSVFEKESYLLRHNQKANLPNYLIKNIYDRLDLLFFMCL